MSMSDPYAMMDHDDEEDVQSCSDSVEEPPFALVDAPAGQLEEVSELVSPFDQSFANCKANDLVSPATSQRTENTAMGSSILYSPTSRAGTGDSSDHVPEEFVDDDSPMSHHTSSGDHLEFIDDNDIEFDAAASLLAESPMLGRSSHFMERSEADEEQKQHSPRDCSYSSMGFSELMQEADDQVMHQIYKSPPMPILPEDHEMSMRDGSSSVLTPRVTNQSMLGIFEYHRDLSSSSSRGIETKRIDQDTFEVSMHIRCCSMNDVMDVVGNPDLLRLWCEPVRTLVVTRSSEGARSATQRSEPGDREVRVDKIEHIDD